MTASLSTPRLLLRGWRESDREPFARLNADPEVMEHFPATLTRPESDAFAERIEVAFEERGFGLWAVEVVGKVPFIGFVGLSEPNFEAHFTPATEIGWRIGRPWWGRGYATEAASAVLDHAFSDLGLAEVVSFTIPDNLRSRAVMERLGMTRDPADDFNHPRFPEAHRVRAHVLYRLRTPLQNHVEVV